MRGTGYELVFELLREVDRPPQHKPSAAIICIPSTAVPLNNSWSASLNDTHAYVMELKPACTHPCLLDPPPTLAGTA